MLVISNNENYLHLSHLDFRILDVVSNVQKKNFLYFVKK